jgi:hypothetical protein
MVEPTQYTFKHRDLIAALIKAQSLHEGLWQLTISFGFGAANVGAAPDDVSPAAVTTIMSVGLQRVETATVPALTVNAAEVNPRA